MTAIPALLMMAAIFAFSARTATESMENSNAVVDQVMKLGPAGMEKESIYPLLSVLIRKGAHMAEFALLCFFVALHLETWQSCRAPEKSSASRRRGTQRAISSALRKNKKIVWISFAFTVFYAATDEFHQLFVEGRSGQVKDVLIDSAGAAMGILAYAGLQWLLLRKRQAKT